MSRQGRNKQPFYRIVLTEHTKPAKSGYQTVLGRYNPLNDQAEYDIEVIKSWIKKGAKPSERLARLLFAATKDELFQKYFVFRTRAANKKKAVEEKPEAAPAAAPAETKPEVKEETKEEVKEEVKPEAPIEEKKDEKVEKAEEKKEEKAE
ncbi:30S ribosomal protein S16 [Patescibacteria group bacterium]|nr:30S ribosomal protein S16 [Patescibacteria group bacterium]MBU1758429.1 30S ribosomal protein S16 [Patescibacteria group bacterium]